MKSNVTVRALVLAAALSALPLFAAPSAASNGESLVPMSGFDEVTVGTHRRDVIGRIGEPSDRFSADVWVYWDYPGHKSVADERYRTVVIVLTGDRVTRIRFTDTAATRTALAQFRRDQAIARLLPTNITLAKKP